MTITAAAQQSEPTAIARGDVRDLEQRREQLLAHVAACRHATVTEVARRGFSAPASGGYTPMAHGGSEVTERCQSCAGLRRSNVNGAHVERGAWCADLSDLDERLAAAHASSVWSAHLDAIEAKGWNGEWLRIDGLTPIRVQIAVLDADDGVALTIDGRSDTYSLGGLERIAQSPQRNEVGRTVWALILRASQRALARARRDRRGRASHA